MTRRTCTCRKWDMTGIPCRHALRVIMHMKWKSDDYVSDWYLTSKWRATYENSISPVTGMRFWRKPDETRIQPPTRPESKGRKKKQKRIKGKNESPKKKRKVQCGEESPKKLKASREGRTMTCGHCGITGISFDGVKL
ncbi:BnaUnng03210D [Brassica napus]|uniref:BnaUnng03210D protein n=1 Tax=Brassica napus TaxID=3708 RepID=A0A078JV14_BRANA|nr:BnaUnng03210D [Brassica napus]